MNNLSPTSKKEKDFAQLFTESEDETDFESVPDNSFDLEPLSPSVESTPGSSFDLSSQIEQEYTPELESDISSNESEQFQPEVEAPPAVSQEAKVKPSSRPSQQVPQVKDEVVQAVENILADGLDDAFLSLTPVQQQEFKIMGEEASMQIAVLLKKAKVNVKKIFEIVLSWLRYLPGINKFFLEQEAKIKTDYILALKNNKEL